MIFLALGYEAINKYIMADAFEKIIVKIGMECHSFNEQRSNTRRNSFIVKGPKKKGEKIDNNT